MDDAEQTTGASVLWPLLDGCSAAESEEIDFKGKANLKAGATCDLCIAVIKGLSPEGRSREIPTKAMNGGYNHCSLISEKKNMMDMEMTSSSVPVCRQGLFLHAGNSLVRDHALSRERLLHVGQLNLAHSDLRSPRFQDSVDSAAPCLNGSHPAQHIKQECPSDYKVLSEASTHRRITEGMELRASGSLHPELDLMNNSFTNSLSSYLFNNEHSSSLGPLSLGTPQHSARLQTSNLKKRCISVVPSSAEGIDITAIIRTSQTSLVTCVNGLRTNSAGISSHPVEISHHSAQKSSQPQSCSQPGNPCSIPSPPACLVPLSTECDRGDCEQMQMQQVEENGSLSLMMNGTSHPHQNSHGTQKVSFLKQEPADDYSSTADLFRHHQGLPPPYHLHQQLSQTPGTLPHLSTSMSPKSLQPSDGDEQDLSSGKQVCQWIDCSATYDQQDELVRHIEKTHIDQRKGEDFTCFWAGCVRRYKPFNARYKLLIHMRVHSGEKPNKCMEEALGTFCQRSRVPKASCPMFIPEVSVPQQQGLCLLPQVHQERIKAFGSTKKRDLFEKNTLGSCLLYRQLVLLCQIKFSNTLESEQCKQDGEETDY
ncbi:hypothetical protein DUI87_14952 [Hirundo rustica rustica]|uniref:C2H2-type domain-containing protein n=1 Tax=Hirundo rustica rustica TaxID=333673 RepID=A0A3M0K691_HIRRU|nr:hypothetical protein DUI87_14952 [Hirundo rustica rustica]